MSYLNKIELRTVETLKKFNIKRSPCTYVWENKIVLNDRPNILYSKNDYKIIGAITNEYKDNQFFVFRGIKDYQYRNNVFSIIDPKQLSLYNPLNENLKIGFFLLDLNNAVETKNILNIFSEYIDDKTVFFAPSLVNFENFDMKILSGIFEYCEKNKKEIKWIAINGNIQLYDIIDRGYNTGVCFYLKSK